MPIWHRNDSLKFITFARCFLYLQAEIPTDRQGYQFCRLMRYQFEYTLMHHLLCRRIMVYKIILANQQFGGMSLEEIVHSPLGLQRKRYDLIHLNFISADNVTRPGHSLLRLLGLFFLFLWFLSFPCFSKTLMRCIHTTKILFPIEATSTQLRTEGPCIDGGV